MSKNKKEVNVDLTLLKKLVGELETTLASAEGLRAQKTETNVYDYVVEMSKCTGLAAGIVQEASLLIGDINQTVRYNTNGAASSKDDSLSSLLSVFKGSGNSN